MKFKGQHIIVGMVIIILILTVIYFIGFTSIGYITTVRHRGFTQIQQNIYMDNDYHSDDVEVLSIISEANVRLAEFWGNVQSHPTIIISDNEKKLKKMGWTGNPALTTTIVLGGAHSYVVISPNGLNIDVVAHELTHAELHKRIYNGKMLPSTLIPIWFDEGVAIQNNHNL